MARQQLACGTWCGSAPQLQRTPLPFPGSVSGGLRASTNAPALPTFNVRTLLWGKDSTATRMRCFRGHWDVVVCSDCLYDANAFPRLVGTLRRVAKPGTLVVLACKRRNLASETGFWRSVESHGFDAFAPPRRLYPREFAADDVYIVFLSKCAQQAANAHGIKGPSNLASQDAHR